AGPGGEKLGDQNFGQATCSFYQEEIEFPFFDAFLRHNGMGRLPAARVFETGVNRWRKFEDWPPREGKATNFYLARNWSIGTKPSGGETAYDEYVSDPANPVPYQGGPIRSRTDDYLIDDQRFASERKDVL